MDKEISGSISDLSLQLSEKKLPHYNKPMEIRFPFKEDLFLVDKIKLLLQKGVINEPQHQKGEYISLNFLVPKSEDFFRIIVNLKILNENMTHFIFEMETITSALTLVTPYCYIPKKDRKDAYCFFPILPEHQKCLKFYFRKNLYGFKFLLIGVCSNPQEFTKVFTKVHFGPLVAGH